MTLNGQRSRSFTSKYDGRWTVLLFTLCLWGVICAGSNAHSSKNRPNGHPARCLESSGLTAQPRRNNHPRRPCLKATTQTPITAHSNSTIIAHSSVAPEMTPTTNHQSTISTVTPTTMLTATALRATTTAPYTVPTPKETTEHSSMSVTPLQMATSSTTKTTTAPLTTISTSKPVSTSSKPTNRVSQRTTTTSSISTTPSTDTSTISTSKPVSTSSKPTIRVSQRTTTTSSISKTPSTDTSTISTSKPVSTSNIPTVRVSQRTTPTSSISTTPSTDTSTISTSKPVSTSNIPTVRVSQRTTTTSSISTTPSTDTSTISTSKTVSTSSKPTIRVSQRTTTTSSISKTPSTDTSTISTSKPVSTSNIPTVRVSQRTTPTSSISTTPSTDTSTISTSKTVSTSSKPTIRVSQRTTTTSSISKTPSTDTSTISTSKPVSTSNIPTVRVSRRTTPTSSISTTPSTDTSTISTSKPVSTSSKPTIRVSQRTTTTSSISTTPSTDTSTISTSKPVSTSNIPTVRVSQRTTPTSSISTTPSTDTSTISTSKTVSTSSKPTIRVSQRTTTTSSISTTPSTDTSTISTGKPVSTSNIPTVRVSQRTTPTSSISTTPSTDTSTISTSKTVSTSSKPTIRVSQRTTTTSSISTTPSTDTSTISTSKPVSTSNIPTVRVSQRTTTTSSISTTPSTDTSTISTSKPVSTSNIPTVRVPQRTTTTSSISSTPSTDTSTISTSKPVSTSNIPTVRVSQRTTTTSSISTTPSTDTSTISTSKPVSTSNIPTVRVSRRTTTTSSISTTPSTDTSTISTSKPVSTSNIPTIRVSRRTTTTSSISTTPSTDTSTISTSKPVSTSNIPTVRVSRRTTTTSSISTTPSTDTSTISTSKPVSTSNIPTVRVSRRTTTTSSISTTPSTDTSTISTSKPVSTSNIPTVRVSRRTTTTSSISTTPSTDTSTISTSKPVSTSNIPTVRVSRRTTTTSSISTTPSTDTSTISTSKPVSTSNIPTVRVSQRTTTTSSISTTPSIDTPTISTISTSKPVSTSSKPTIKVSQKNTPTSLTLTTAKTANPTIIYSTSVTTLSTNTPSTLLTSSSTTSACPTTLYSEPVIIHKTSNVNSNQNLPTSTSGSAVVTGTLRFNSSTPVPSEALVLKALMELRNARESQLHESVKLLNVTYEKISETSYELKLSFAVSNFTMSVIPEERNDILKNLQEIVNNAVNTLLNEPGKPLMKPNSTDFQSLLHQIKGTLNYIFQDGEAIQPVSFLLKLQSPMVSSTTSVPPLTRSLNLVPGSAVVKSVLQFSSSSPVPSEALVLNAISDLLIERQAKLNDSVKLTNYTYEKISETSYNVILTFAVSNITMPVDPEKRNETLKNLQDIVNNAVNIILNEPGKPLLKPNSTDFQSLSDQINGTLNYSIQDGEGIQPVSFLLKLQSPMVSSTTSVPPLTTSLNLVPGSAVVKSVLQFSSSSPVPSEALVLNAISDLLIERQAKLNDSVKLTNYTYEKISETSYNVILTFAVSNITMPVDPEQRNDTLKNLQDIVNNAVNIILNEPGKPLLKPNSTDFQSLTDQINGTLNYIFQDGEAIQPVSFLLKLQSPMVSSTTSVAPLTTSLNLVPGSAVVKSVLQFSSSSPVPSEALVLNAISDLLIERQAKLNDSVKLTNYTYEKISETSYNVILTFAVSNITMPVDLEKRNDTLKNLQDFVNNAVNIILNEPGKPLLKPNSTDFQSLSDQINGTLNYIFQDGEAIQPVSFLLKLQSPMVSSTTSVPPLTTSLNLVPGSAVVKSVLQFSSSSPVPSEALVLNAISDLLIERQAKLNDSVKLTNYTYEKISETSYNVILTFAVSNITMPVDPEKRNETLKNLQDIVNNAVNIILNEPGKPLLKPNSTDFQSLSDQINGTLNYSIQDGEGIQPVSFLLKLQSPMVSSTTSVAPLTTSLNLVPGSAVVKSVLQFSSSSPVPSEALVLNAISDLLIERQAKLNDSVKLTNYTYEKISETSYNVILTFAVSNITMPVDPEKRNETLKNLQDIVNNAVNIILNEPGKPLLKPNSTDFQSLSDQINGTLNYSIQDGEGIQPVSFLLKLQSPMVSSTTSVPPLTTSLNLVPGSAVVKSVLQFSSSSPVPSEALVLNAISDLLIERQAKLNDSVKLTNYTYEKISETSYNVILTFAVSNITMPVDPEQRNDTLKNLQDIVNNAVNIILNEPGKPLLKPNSTDFQSLTDQINGTLNYIFQDGEAIQPVSFLLKLQSPMVSSTTSVPPLTTSLNLVPGSAVVKSVLQFSSSSPVPSEALVLNAISDLLIERQAKLNDSVKLTNYTYEKISETSYNVILTFAVSNITMPVDPEKRNETLKNLQDIVNNAVNIILNEPGKPLLKPNSTDFQSLSDQINGTLNYSIQDGEGIQPVSFLLKLQSPMVSSTTSVAPLTTSLNLVPGSAVVKSVLQFSSSSPVPSEALVLNAISDLLIERQAKLNDSVKLTNYTYEKISETSYNVILTFAVSNITMPVDPEKRNETLKNLQDIVNNAVNIILNEPGKPLLKPNSTDFQSLSDQINGTLNYIFQDGEAIQPVSFLLKLQSPMVSSTTSVPPLTTSLNLVPGSAVVKSVLQFSSSSPVPSEALVLNAISDLLIERQAKLNDSVKLTNYTYEKISETSYNVILTFAVSNITMPVDLEKRNDTLKNLQDIVNNAVNIILNEPGKPLLKPNSTDFQSLSDQINGTLNYSIQDGEGIQPVSFLLKLQSPMVSSTTSVPPLTTSLNLVPGSAVVKSVLQFSSSSPVPSEALVLNAISDLLIERQAKLNDSVKLTNYTYEKISETSYNVILTFAVSNITMPVDPEKRNETLKNLQDIVNNAVNIILNEPGKPLLKPNSTDFQSLSDQINGTLNYSIQDGEGIQPVSFLLKLQSPMVSSTTSVPPLTTSLNLVPGSAVVKSVLQFSSSSPVPSEALVLNAISDLLIERQAKLNDSVKLTNYTYEKISETSYNVILTFAVSNITMPVDPEQRNDTLKNLQDIVNNAVNIILNEPGKPLLKPNSTDFQSLTDQINGTLNYIFQDGEAIQPVSFLLKLQSPMVSSTTSVPPLTTSLNLVPGSAVVKSVLQFSSSSPVPSEALVLNAISDLLIERQAKLNDSVKLTNYTYEKISETSYNVILTFAVSNITMPVDPEKRNETLKNLQDIVNNAVNIILNEPGKPLLKPNSTDFQSLSDQINGTLNYSIQDGEGIQPVSFLLKLQSPMVSSTTSVPPLTTSLNLVPGSAVVKSVLQFSSSSPVPSEALVLNAISDLLIERQAKLNDSVKLTNYTYEKISETSYNVILTFAVSNITMPVDPEKRNETLKNMQDIVNNAVNIILNEPGKPLLKPNSTDFQSLSDQINGTLNYSIQDGEGIQPVSFLLKLQSPMVSSTTSVPPLTTSLNLVPGSAVVKSVLQFSSSSPVPSEALVLNAISDLLIERQAKLNDSVKLTNYTYEKISETSYNVILTFAVSNITMPVDPEKRNETLKNLQDIVNNAVNIILNEPGKPLLKPNSTDFQSLSDQINGTLNYSIQDGEGIQPVSFLLKLQSPMVSSTTSVPPLTTSLNLVPGSAVVKSVLQFSSSSPVPSEALVLNAISDLLIERQAKLNDSVKLTNYTYEKISETSYNVILTFAVSNITMPVDPEKRNETLKNMQDIVNNAVNIILNEPGKPLLKPNSTDFQSLSDQINGTLNYSIQDGEGIQPVSFLLKLQSPMVSSTTSVPPLTTSLNLVPGSAVVKSVLQFSSSSPVPSEALVLNAISDLLIERQAKLNDSVKLTNYTYEKISETSYNVILTFAVSNITMPVDLEKRNDTLKNLQDIVNNAVNIILNEPGKPLLKPNSTDFQSLSDQINGTLNYIFQDGEAIQPVSFLLKLQSPMVSSTTSVPPLTTSENLVFGSAVVKSILQFNSSSPVPSEALVLKAIIDLWNERQAQLNASVNLTDYTYEKISETSYNVILTFAVSNITMPMDPKQRNNPHKNLEDMVKYAVNIVLNDPGNTTLIPVLTNFQNSYNLINGSLNYIIQEGESIQPVSYLQKLQSLMAITPTTKGTPLARVIIKIRLVFITVGTFPSESIVMQLAQTYLEPSLRTKRSTHILKEDVKFVNVTYEGISDKEFALNFEYRIDNQNNKTMINDPVIKNETLISIQQSIDELLNRILNAPSTKDFKFKQASFTDNGTVILANIEYIFLDSDITTPSIFVRELRNAAAAAATTFSPTVINTSGPNNSTSLAWIVAIIVPCAIAILLIPCWILLCCLLCGCCAAVRQRWERRRSYNIRYYIHNL
ncbi:serine-rich adhesin for platelets-like [Triplophysa dalaica]|uniref:serine-rich adhesin for platelets-like n=1 Tax=Triplophysa dalaica TaxID=1582913 RepID=UPI0024E0383F|nr:serine-rich adhesin for platelets-like [Triplophysa dalaica]